MLWGVHDLALGWQAEFGEGRPLGTLWEPRYQAGNNLHIELSYQPGHRCDSPLR